MKMNLVSLFSFFIFLYGFLASAQEKVESQYRIKKSQFPSEAIDFITQNSTTIKHLKFYLEVDTVHKTYTAKFKKARLHYQVNFNQNGEFENISFTVKRVDIPEESYDRISKVLLQYFEKAKIRKIFQLYARAESESIDETLKSAYQNLITPSILYKFLVRGKINRKREDYKLIFYADGKLKEIRKSLPTNHDRILY